MAITVEKLDYRNADDRETVLRKDAERVDILALNAATINPRSFRTGFNDRMCDTLEQWYGPARNFKQEKAIRDVQQLFVREDLQLDPQGMMDVMIETIPAEAHKFRNVYPPRFIENVKEYQEGLWELEMAAPAQGKAA
ncbi:MAG: hypothetical protein AAF074_20310 [Pseudomonadota bacterium]